MYESQTYGNPAGTNSPLGNLQNALGRMSAIGATSILVPGPKMIWHFADLGMDDSIYTCDDGSVNSEGDATPGDCKLATKPQPQWANSWRRYRSRPNPRELGAFIDLKKNEPVLKAITPSAPTDLISNSAFTFTTTLYR
jgi:hypothetical protein